MIVIIMFTIAFIITLGLGLHNIYIVEGIPYHAESGYATLFIAGMFFKKLLDEMEARL